MLDFRPYSGGISSDDMVVLNNDNFNRVTDVIKRNYDNLNAKIGWEYLGSTTNTNQSSITISNLPARKYLDILARYSPSTTMDVNIRFNSDTGSNYAWRLELNGVADTEGVSQTGIRIGTGTSATRQFIRGNIYNDTTWEKHGLFYNYGSNVGAGSSVFKRFISGKWANTTNSISSITLLGSTGNLGVAELLVLGRN